MPVILVVDDDPDIRSLLIETLTLAGYAVRSAANGPQALEIAQSQACDLALLDVKMPGLSGLDLLDQLKELAPALPVILVTCLRDHDTPVQALRRGACDYITKPFDPAEVRVAVHRALSRQWSAEQIRVGEWTLNLTMRRVWHGEGEIELTPLEFDLLAYLIRRAGRVVTWQELLAQVWGYPHDTTGQDMVRACVKRLRHKLEADPKRPRYLTTVWGKGYRWEVTPALARRAN